MVREAATTSHGHAREERGRTHVMRKKLVHGQWQNTMLNVIQRLNLLPLRTTLHMIAAPAMGSPRKAMQTKAFVGLGRRQKQAQPERMSLNPLSPVER